MALFVLVGRDGARGLELRKLHREAHLANLKPLADAGRVVFAGPTSDADEAALRLGGGVRRGESRRRPPLRRDRSVRRPRDLRELRGLRVAPGLPRRGSLIA